MRQCLHRELAIILQDFECVEQHEWVAVVEALLDAVADLAADETDGISCLHLAAYNWIRSTPELHALAGRLCAAAGPALLNGIDWGGRTPLHDAAERRSWFGLALVEAGASCRQAVLMHINSSIHCRLHTLNLAAHSFVPLAFFRSVAAAFETTAASPQLSELRRLATLSCCAHCQTRLLTACNPGRSTACWSVPFSRCGHPLDVHQCTNVSVCTTWQ